MYCFITTVPIALYRACSDDIGHYELDEMVNFSRFRCATMSPIAVLYKLHFLDLYLLFLCLCMPKLGACNHRRRKVSKSVWAMASAVARAYNGGLGAEPPAGVQGAEPPVGARGALPP